MRTSMSTSMLTSPARLLRRPVARLLVLLTGFAVLVSGSTTLTAGAASNAVASFGGIPVGCVGAAASFNHQAYCLDNDAETIAASQGPLDNDQVAFGMLQLNGWQVPTRCNGNGVSGKREQLVYVHVQGAPDVFSQVQSFILNRLITGANGVYEHTTGGKRAVRWVTRTTATGCVPTILKVTVPATANTQGEPFYTIGSAVQAAVGGVKTNRSYLVLVDHPDAFGDCGLGQVRPDASPGPGNASNVGGAFAMVWANCWTGLVAAHELTHTMGAVQPEAPHHTDNGHCWDGRDDMCYPDGSRQQQRLICKQPDDFRLLDCNHDDYFALFPKPGSYLASHWNSANSAFLIDSKPVALPTLPGVPTGVTVTMVNPTHVRVAWAPGVTLRGAPTSWTVLVGARDGGTETSDDGSYPVTDSDQQLVLGPRARSILVAVKPDAVQGFAVYESNASGDGPTSAIVSGGAGAPPTPIVATYSDTYGPEVDWTGGTSDDGVTTCTAVTVNGVRADGYTGSLADTTDPMGQCYSAGSPTFLAPPLPTDVIQVYARNAFGTTVVTVAH